MKNRLACTYFREYQFSAMHPGTREARPGNVILGEGAISCERGATKKSYGARSVNNRKDIWSKGHYQIGCHKIVTVVLNLVIAKSKNHAG